MNFLSFRIEKLKIDKRLVCFFGYNMSGRISVTVVNRKKWGAVYLIHSVKGEKKNLSWPYNRYMKYLVIYLWSYKCYLK